ncbi:MAG TPA: hypothetical protein VJU83_04105 [Burkholderiales bacterium]|nr:hypothetical protein [Burkholderiales bacterium]
MDSLVSTDKYRFRIRTRLGGTVDKIVIQARTPADAERKLKQMYPHCEIIESNTGAVFIPRMLALRGEPSILPGQ